MRIRYGFLAVVLAFGAGAMLPHVPTVRAQQQQITGSNYLYFEEFELAPGAIPNSAISEASDWVRGMRGTGEFKSVRLYIHNTGPRFALYVLVEPKSWQAIETGFEKFFAARPDMMTRPFNWGSHSDNLLSEIPVQ